MDVGLFIVAFFAGVAFSSPTVPNGPAWDALRVTWNPNPFSKYGFAKMPRSLKEPLAGFELRDNQCTTPNAKFRGQRYWSQKDPALTLLFDTQGTIAGIQSSIPKSKFTPYPYLTNNRFIEDGDFWTLTAYFVDPKTICATGRSQDQLAKEGTGTGLWLQIGVDPIANSVQVPSNEEDVKKPETNWTFGHCFWTMGNHYWYNVTKNMNCDHFMPNCLMYNKGKLTAFCFATNGVFESPRYEHPSNDDAKAFIAPIPDCFYTDPSYKRSSTIHVYMIDNPRTGSFC